MKLATIGYEGLNPDQFFNLLTKNKIDLLIDIRELPLSRKPGFSKTALKTNAKIFGLDYIHMANLGCPRIIRHDYRDDKNWEKYSQRYLSYLETQDDEITELLNIISIRSGCILCYEANPARCHRCYVAKAVADLAGSNFDIIHLVAKEMPAALHELSVGKLVLQ